MTLPTQSKQEGNNIRIKSNIRYFDDDFEGSLCGADKEVSE